MSSVALSTRLNALDLDPSEEEETPVKTHEIQPTRPRSRAGSSLPSISKEESSSPKTRDSMIQKEAAIPSPVQNVESKSQPGPSTSKVKDRQPRTRNRKSHGGKPQANSSAQSEKDSLPKFAYVVEVCLKGPVKEKILGIFANLAAANEAATAFAEQNGFQRRDIVDIVSSLDIEEKDKPVSSAGKGRAIRRTWADGATVIRPRIVSGTFSSISVLPKELSSVPEGAEKALEKDKVYLALDKSDTELYIGGAFWTKDEAWEACEKYWTQLSTPWKIKKRDEWVDEQGLGHVEGVLGETSHHWFVQAYRFDEKVA